MAHSKYSPSEPMLQKWINKERPHESLGNIPPAEYLEINSPQDVSTFGWR